MACSHSLGATLVSDHWGPERYAALNGILQAPRCRGCARASVRAGIAAITGSYRAVFAILAVLAAGAAALAAAAGDPSALRRDAELVE